MTSHIKNIFPNLKHFSFLGLPPAICCYCPSIKNYGIFFPQWLCISFLDFNQSGQNISLLTHFTSVCTLVKWVNIVPFWVKMYTVGI